MGKITIGAWSALAVIFTVIVGCTDTQPHTVKSKKANTSNDVNSYLLTDERGIPKITAASAPLTVKAQHDGLQPSHVRGARIYDDFFIELDEAVTNKNPLLALASGDTAGISNEDSYRCSQCHGYDYEGGKFTFNNGATNNLLELREVRGHDEDYVLNMLFNGFNMWDGSKVVNVHNYSALLTPQSIVDVSDFVVNEIFDTHEFIRAPSSESLGDPVEGDEIFNSVAVDTIPPLIMVDGTNFNCVSCHTHDDADATGIDLTAAAWEDPFKFLHRTLFGSPRSLTTHPGFVNDPTVMPGLYEIVLTDGLHFGGPEQGAAVMMYSQCSFTDPCPVP